MKKILSLLPALLLVGGSSAPADDEPNFTDTSPHSTSSDSGALADADADSDTDSAPSATAKLSKPQKAEKDDDSALAAQVGGMCGIRDYAQIIADDTTDCAFALDIYNVCNGCHIQARDSPSDRYCSLAERHYCKEPELW